MNTGKKVIFIVPLVTSIVAFIGVMLAVYFKWLGAEGVTALEFCEAIHPGFIKQPVNTWSNLGFIFAGLVAAWQTVSGKFAEKHNVLTTTIFYPAFFCSLMVWLGPGSMAMHASTTDVGGLLDMVSMYLVSTFLLSYALTRYYTLSHNSFLAVFAAGFVISLFFFFNNYHILPGALGQMLLLIFVIYLMVGGLLEILLVIRHRGKSKPRWAIFSAIAMILAFGIWQLGITGRPTCDPSSLVQYHGVWHILNAVSVYALYRYYVSEDITNKREMEETME
jgi:hypothetical protein